jgi:MerR family transcriptional regulator, light-induced transcriptional regulator
MNTARGRGHGDRSEATLVVHFSVSVPEASLQGWATTYLGPNLPAEDIAAAARRLEARAVALSIVYPSTDPRLPGELRRLRGQLAPGVLLLVGGSGAAAHSNLLGEIGAVLVRDIADLPAVLTRAESAGSAPAECVEPGGG